MWKSVNPYVDKLDKNPIIAKYFAPERRSPPDLWSRAEMETYQREALQYLLAHVYANSLYYRSKFDAAGVGPQDLHELSDIALFPFVRKDELRRAPWTALSTSRDRVCQIHMSTGTTSESIGDHIYSLLSWDDIFLNEVAARFAFMMPYRPGDVVVVALPYEMSSAGFSMHRAYQQASGCVVVNAGKGGFYSEPKKTVLMLRDLKANVLATTASYALYLWEAATELGIDVVRDIGLKFMWLGGEGSSDALRRRVEALWGCPCLRYYSSLECGPIGIECPFQDGLHIPENYSLVEIVDPVTGEVLPDGEVGEICITVLYRFGGPFIRYRIGDRGLIDRSPCKCCLERPRIFLKGRPTEHIGASGRAFSPFEIEERLFELDEMGNNYGLVVKGERVALTAEVARGHDKAALRRRLDEVLRDYPVSEITVVDHIPRTYGKAVRVKHQAA